MILLKGARRHKQYNHVKKTETQKHLNKIKTKKCKTILKKLRVLWRMRGRKSGQNQLKQHLLDVQTSFYESTLNLHISYGLQKHFRNYPRRSSCRLLIFKNNNLLFFRSIRLSSSIFHDNFRMTRVFLVFLSNFLNLWSRKTQWSMS